MSDAPREEEIYQALAPGSSYKSGLSNPVAEIPMRFKGAMGGGAVGNEDYPDHEPRASVPYKHYKDLEDIDPKLHEAVTHVADEIHIPRTDLASLVYANSDYDPQARKGMRTGYMGLTPDDARQLDPEGHLDINDPIDNLFMGAMKYKRISNRFGMGTPNAFAAYYGGGDRIRTLLDNDPDEHRRMAPDGTFEFLNKVLGNEGSGGGAPPVDSAGAGGDQGSDVAGMAAAAQAGAQPQRFVPGQGAVLPMVPNQPGVGAALAYTGSLPSQVSPYRSYEGPPEAPRPAEQGTYAGSPEGAPPRAAIPPYYPQEISRPQGAGAGRQPDASQATQALLADRERIDRATPVPPDFYSRGSQVPRQPNYNLDPNAPPPPDDTGWQRPMPPPGPPIDDTGWQRPVPPGPPVDDTNWQRPLPPPELTGQGGVLAPAPVQSTEDTRPTVTPPPPDTSGGYTVGGAIGSRVQEQVPDNYPGQPPVAQAGQPQPTIGSGAPPAAAPAPRQQAIGTDNMAADLNRQELARVQGGRPDVIPTGPTQAGAAPATGSGALPTIAPGAGGDTAAPAANLPAGAPKALAPPGSTPTATAAPPIDRLQGNGGAMTPASAVRAGAQGPGEVLTHIARNGPRGMSIGDGWDHFQDLLERAMIMKGDINGLQHAQEYVFRMKHKGAMENLMQAIGSMDDPETAVRFLAKSHAFVTDGTAIGFQVLNNQIYGQKYDEQTHDKIGKPFSVTEQGLRQLAIAHSDPSKFNAALNTERQTNETGRHNRKTEQHNDAQLKQSGEISERSLKEKQIEFETRTADRRAEQAALDKRARELQAERLQEQADQKERDRQAANERARAAAHERTLAADERRAEAQRVRQEKQEASDLAKAEKAAELKASHAKAVSEEVGEMYGTDTQPGMLRDPKDDKKSAFKPTDIARASQLHMGIRAYNEDIAPNVAAGYVKNLIEGKYKLDEYEDDPGYAHVLDDQGKSLARVPRSVWRAYLPPPKAPTGTRPNPRPQQR